MSPRLLLPSLLCLTGLAWPTGAHPSPGQPAPSYEVELSPAGGWLLGPGGVRLLSLSPTLLLAVADPASRPGKRSEPLRPRRITFTPWQVERSEGSFLLRGQATAGPLRYRLELEAQPGGLELRLVSEAVQWTAVRAEVLELRTGPSLQAALVDRTLRWTPLRQASFGGLLDVQRLRLASGPARITLAGGPGLQGLWARPGPEGGVLLELELDHQANHPFHPLIACSPRRQTIGHGWLDLTLRPAGSTRQLSVRLLLGDPWLPLVARFPRGAQAALVLTDHADQSNAAKLEALAFGATGAVEAGRLGPEHPGLVNRGLVYTKSIFVRRVHGYAQQLESEAYRALLARLQKQGVELALHSPTGAPDSRARLRKLLPEFRSFAAGRTWIDHQPSSNCEALSNQGWDPRSKYHALDLLLEAGFRHFWSGEDLPTPPGSLNLLWPERPGSRDPLLYPFGLARDPEVWLFASTPLFVDREAVLAALDEKALRRLEQEHGLYIAHVYLDTFQKPSERFSQRSLLQFGDGPGRYRVRPEVDQIFQRLAAHQRAGRLWVTGVDALLDFVRGRTGVELRPGQPGEVLITSRSALRGLTLRLPPGSGRVTVEGGAPAGERSEGGEPQIWLDLQPGKTRRLRVRGHFAAPSSVILREASHE